MFRVRKRFFDRVHGIEITDLPLDADYVAVEVQGGQEEIGGEEPRELFQEIQHRRRRSSVPHAGGELLGLGDLPPQLGDRIDDPRGIGIALLEFGGDVPLERRQTEAGAVVVETDLDAGQDKDNERRNGAPLQTVPGVPRSRPAPRRRVAGN